MSLSDSQLHDLARRVSTAALRGYAVARGATYAAMLCKETGLKGTGSAQDLYDLCKAALAKRAGKPITAKTAAPEPEPEVEEEEEPDEEEEEEEEEEEGYSAWTKDELYEEAQSRDIDGRSKMDKAELIEALEASDEDEIEV